jgi:hypothetical protein
MGFGGAADAAEVRNRFAFAFLTFSYKRHVTWGKHNSNDFLDAKIQPPSR